MRWALAGVALGVLAGCGGAAAEVDVELPSLEAPVRAASGRYAVELEAHPAPPAVGQLFMLTTRLTFDGQPVEGARVAVDAAMPQHGHGMVTRPVHRELGGGLYRSEGMKLHMPGRWVLEVRVGDVRVGDVRVGAEGELRLTVPIEQPPVPVRRARR